MKLSVCNLLTNKLQSNKTYLYALVFNFYYNGNTMTLKSDSTWKSRVITNMTISIGYDMTNTGLKLSLRTKALSSISIQ